MKTYHKISVDESTYTALQQRAAYIKQLTDRPISAAMVVRWLVCGKLDIKGEVV